MLDKQVGIHYREISIAGFGMNKLEIFINEELALEYDKDTPLDEQKMAFLDKMDSDMDKGIKLQGELVNQPDKTDKSRFVSLNLVKALQQDNHASIAVSCAWLVQRNPEISEIRIADAEAGIDIQFVEG